MRRNHVSIHITLDVHVSVFLCAQSTGGLFAYSSGLATNSIAIKDCTFSGSGANVSNEALY